MDTERLSRAQTSKSLRQRGYADGDVDVVAASGLAQAQAKTQLKALMARARWDVAKAHQLIKPMAALIRTKCQQSRWRLRGQRDMERLAALAIHLWREPNCPSCGGRKFERLGQMLSDVPCQTCDGTGQRPIPDADNIGFDRPLDQSTLTRYVKNLITRLERGEQGHVEETRRRLG